MPLIGVELTKNNKNSMKHVKVFEQFINEGRAKATTLLQDVANGNTSSAEGIKMSKDMAAHMLNWVNTSPYGKKYGDLPLHKLVKASFSWGIERGLDPKLKGELKDLQSQVAESLTESHFQVGDKVKCIASGMTGKVVSLDDPAETPDAKYYNVKREDGKMIKYAPDELALTEAVTPEPGSEEIQMALGELERIGDYAGMISDRIKSMPDLESWVQSKITKAKDYLTSVHDYLDGIDGDTQDDI
jgi:hypothetical protein